MTTTIRTVFRDTPPVESVPVSPYLTGEYDADGMLVAQTVTMPETEAANGKSNARGNNNQLGPGPDGNLAGQL